MGLLLLKADKVVVIPLGGKKCTSPVENSFTNSIGMTFNLIPSGTFTMGSPDGSSIWQPAEPGRYDNETQHRVTLTKSFYMQITEVTNEQWNTLIVDTGLGAKPSTSHTEDEYPVETVTWYEAAYFANRLSVVEGLYPCYTLLACNGKVPGAGMECTSVAISNTCSGYRLPTEAQWEYAARASNIVAYANPVYFDWSNKETGSGFNSNLAAMGWYVWNRFNSGYGDGTKPMAQKQPNRWGLYDMHGNVSEWCLDWWDGSDYSSAPVTDPTGDVTGSYHVIRGGGWGHSARDARSANRGMNSPGDRDDDLGFRLSLPLGQ